jgi:hypothetical protein
MKITKVADIFGLLAVKVIHLINCWATFWAIFSQTSLVTLVADNKQRESLSQVT